MYFWKYKSICIYFSNLCCFKYLCIFAQVPYSCIHLFYNTINVIKFLMLKFVNHRLWRNVLPFYQEALCELKTPHPTIWSLIYIHFNARVSYTFNPRIHKTFNLKFGRALEKQNEEVQHPSNIAIYTFYKWTFDQRAWKRREYLELSMLGSR